MGCQMFSVGIKKFENHRSRIDYNFANISMYFMFILTVKP